MTGFDLVTFDAPDTDGLARFWCGVLGAIELEREDGDRWRVIGTDDGHRLIGFQKGPARPGGIHLDLRCPPAEFDTEVARLLALGARLIRPTREEPYGRIANLADPGGYAFDLCAYP